MKVDAKNHSQWEPELKQLFKICTEGVNRPDPGRQWPAYLETCPEETKFLTNARKTSSGKAAFDFRPHQREAIGLLRQAEQSNHRGAILADDMGLGKTITAIGLDQIYPIGRPTLIILPDSLIPMWESEYESLCGPSLKVYHHTGAVKINGAQLSSKDVVLVTSSKLEAEYLLLEEIRLNFIHRREHPNERFRVEVDRNNPKKTKTVEVHINRPSIPLFVVDWGRIIFDGGRWIIDQDSTTHQAAVKLSALHRIVLTGRPYANEYTDIQSLFTLLQIAPLNDELFFKAYFTKTVTDRQNQFESRILEAKRRGTLKACLAAITIRRKNRSVFDGQG